MSRQLLGSLFAAAVIVVVVVVVVAAKFGSTSAAERESLEEQWNRGEEASTEDLRVALQRYRSFFERLLAV